MGTIINNTAKGQLITLRFMQDAIAASQTDAQLPVIETGATTGTTAVTDLSMPFDGDVVAMSWDLSAAGTAGVFTIGVTVDGTENTTTTQTVGTGTSGYPKFARGACSFVSGQELGVEITTDGSWDGTTADLVVTLYVLVDLTGV